MPTSSPLCFIFYPRFLNTSGLLVLLGLDSFANIFLVVYVGIEDSKEVVLIDFRTDHLETAERLWLKFFADPSQWWHNKSGKVNWFTCDEEGP